MSRYGGGVVNITEFDRSDLMENAGWKSEDTPVIGSYSVSYGFDHACGYFIQLMDITDEDLFYDLDSLFTGLTGVKLGYFLKKYSINSIHSQTCFLDLPI